MNLSTLLRREVRLNLGQAAGSRVESSGYGGYPRMEFLGCHVRVTVGVRDLPDPKVGYVVSISRIDAAVRERLAPLLDSALLGLSDRPPLHHLPQRLLLALEGSLPHPVESLELAPSPTLRLTSEKSMNQTVLIGRTFEFAASHRLQSAALSEAENQAQYGRCNNACGHGHNYRIEVTVEHPTEGNSRMADIDLAVQAGVLSRFDHQNLDARPEFAGRVTSVEHIAAVCFDLLQRELAALGIPLRRVQVWETDRTSATVDAAR